MEVLLDEVESLEAILMDDVKIVRSDSGIPELIETTILPTVGEEVDRQYVCVTLQVIPSENYPDDKPKWNLRNPRGLDDQSINKIGKAIDEKIHESVGQPIVFDLIEVIREHLTNSNLPSGQCVICLYDFQDGDEFTKTICYHYLHSYCLARHLVASKRNYEEELEKLPTWQRKTLKSYQPCCPVCRDSIDNEIEPLLQSQAPNELKNAPTFELTHELKGLQARMSNLFMHQKSRGGIIDLDAEEINVISINSEDEGTSYETPTVVTLPSVNSNRSCNGNLQRNVNKKPQQQQRKIDKNDDTQSSKSTHYGYTGRRQGGRRDDHRNYHNRRRHEFSHHQNGTDQTNTSSSSSSSQQPCGSNQR